MRRVCAGGWSSIPASNGKAAVLQEPQHSFGTVGVWFPPRFFSRLRTQEVRKRACAAAALRFSLRAASSWSKEDVPLEVSELLPPPSESRFTSRSQNSQTCIDATAGGSEPPTPNEDNDDGLLGMISSAAHVETVEELDMFARAKILNFIKRMRPSPPPPPEAALQQSATASTAEFDVRRVHTFDGTFEYHARIRLPLPDAYGVRFGEGHAPTDKDAEVVAAMHAERVIDALGFPLFQLSSKQEKHAVAARAAGRWAFQPSRAATEPRPPPSTPSPPALQLVLPSANRVVDSQLNDDERSYALVGVGHFSPLKLTLASPLFRDDSSVARIREYFATAFGAFALKSSMRQFPLHHLHKAESMSRQLKRTTTNVTRGANYSSSSKDTGSPGIARRGDEMWLTQICLPLPDAFGRRIASGRASDRKASLTMACMHCELLLDALGVPLYPLDGDLQAQHAKECERVGRWATSATGSEAAHHYRYSAVAPPPLKFSAETVFAETVVPQSTSGHEASGHRDAAACGGATVSLPFEEELQLHSRAIRDMRCVTRINFLDRSSESHLRQYLLRYAPSTAGDRPGSPDSRLFMSQALGVAGHETHRCTARVPLPRSVTRVGSSHGSRGAPATFSEFVAIGIAPSAEDAVVCCCMHALQVLGLLGVPVYTDDAQQYDFAVQVRSLGGVAPSSSTAAVLKDSVTDSWLDGVLHCAMKFCPGNALGRIKLGGLSEDDDVDSDAVESAVSDTSTSSSLDHRCRQKLNAAQAFYPKQVWSLEADTGSTSDQQTAHHTTGSWILVHPELTDRDTRRFTTTFATARCIDSSSMHRVMDYMERHGIDVSSAFSYTNMGPSSGAAGAGEAEDVYVTATLRIPMPAAVGFQKAIGRAPTKEEAAVVCAMHAEMLVDFYGVALYDHVDLQRRHAATVSSLGRYANPHISLAKDRALLSPPPPLWKPIASSAVWVKHLQCRYGGSLSDDATGKSPSTLIEWPDEHHFDLMRMQAVTQADVTVPLRAYLTRYFSRCGLHLAHEMQQFTKVGPRGHMLYCASLVLPGVAAPFGTLAAAACASSKRTAYFLCIVHAVRVMDAVGVPLFASWSQQRTHAEFQLSRGLAQPPLSEEDTHRSPASVVIPPPLKLLEPGADIAETVELPPVPPRPSSDAIQSPNGVAWGVYIKQCRAYVNAKREAEVHASVTLQRRAPRSGIDIEDAGLDHVEERNAPFDPHAKASLARLANRAGLPVPDYFSTETFGRSPNRMVLAQQAVLGTPLTASGVGVDNRTAIGRAAMHYAWMLNAILAGQVERPNDKIADLLWSGACPSVSSGARAVQKVTHDDAATQVGLVQLIAATVLPTQPIRLTLRQRPHANGATIHTCIADVSDETGLRVSSKGEVVSDPAQAKAKAMSELLTTLKQRSQVQSLCRAVASFDAAAPLGHATVPAAATLAASLSLIAPLKKSVVEDITAASELCGPPRSDTPNHHDERMTAVADHNFDSVVMASSELAHWVQSGDWGVVSASSRPLGEKVVTTSAKLLGLVDASTMQRTPLGSATLVMLRHVLSVALDLSSAARCDSRRSSGVARGRSFRQDLSSSVSLCDTLLRLATFCAVAEQFGVVDSALVFAAFFLEDELSRSNARESVEFRSWVANAYERRKDVSVKLEERNEGGVQHVERVQVVVSRLRLQLGLSNTQGSSDTFAWSALLQSAFVYAFAAKANIALVRQFATAFHPNTNDAFTVVRSPEHCDADRVLEALLLKMHSTSSAPRSDDGLVSVAACQWYLLTASEVGSRCVVRLDNPWYALLFGPACTRSNAVADAVSAEVDKNYCSAEMSALHSVKRWDDVPTFAVLYDWIAFSVNTSSPSVSTLSTLPVANAAGSTSGSATLRHMFALREACHWCIQQRQGHPDRPEEHIAPVLAACKLLKSADTWALDGGAHESRSTSGRTQVSISDLISLPRFSS